MTSSAKPKSADDIYRPEWIKWYRLRWSDATKRFDAEQKGWYMNLLMEAAGQGIPPGYLPDDDKELRQIAEVKDLDADVLHKFDSDPEFLQSQRNKIEEKWARVLKKFIKSVDPAGMIYNPMQVKILKEANNKKSLVKKAADIRWDNHREQQELNARALRTQSISNANIDIEKESTLVSVKDTETLLVLEALDSNSLEERKKNVYRSQANEIFEFWKLELEHPRTFSTPDKIRKIESRLKEGFTVEQVKNAIKGCKLSPHHMGENEQGRTYHSIELICRSGTKVEWFIDVYERHLASGGNNGSTRQNPKPRESAGEKKLQSNADYIAELRRSGGGDNRIDPPGPTLSLDDD